MLELRELTCRFGAKVAVNAASAQISTGEMVGIIGRSGAGKSTLLRMINRLLDPTSGIIEFDGRNVTGLKGGEKRAWQRDCAMIFQQFNLVPRLDVVTNVMLGRLNQRGLMRTLFKAFGRDDIHDALAALERLDIVETALQRAETLSGGQQQRVAIARALMQGPKLILADEPIASLDPLSAEVVMKSLREINKRDGLTVLCNLHTLDTARTYCERVIGMRDGAIVFDGPSSELSASTVREIYGADSELEESVTSTSITSARPVSNGAGVLEVAAH